MAGWGPDRWRGLVIVVVVGSEGIVVWFLEKGV